MNDIDILKEYFSGEKLDKALEEYENGMPAAYIIGEWEFFGDRYILNNECLIPRCDTERVVEKVIESLNDGFVYADLCTGSGCIAISSLKRTKNTVCTAVDVSKKAIEAATQNAEINGVSDRIEFLCADIFSLPLAGKKFDLIVSNPPYIPSSDVLQLDEYVAKEPRIALDGGESGMDFYNFIVANYKNNLKENGVFIFEIGYDQEEKIKECAAKNNFSCMVFKDYSGNPRVALLK